MYTMVQGRASLMEKSVGAFVNSIKHFQLVADERNVARLILAEIHEIVGETDGSWGFLELT